jgi:hypothetical protein
VICVGLSLHSEMVYERSWGGAAFVKRAPERVSGFEGHGLHDGSMFGQFVVSTQALTPERLYSSKTALTWA